MNRPLTCLLGACLVLGAGASAQAADLAKLNDWSALASDRSAGQVGDSLTVLIQESAYASNSSQVAGRKGARLNGESGAGRGDIQTARAGLEARFDGQGQAGRTDRMVAQISVVVTEVLPGGDLRVAGAQRLRVNGEDTLISVSGRVRKADISGSNSVLSTRLADAEITYDGRGFSGKSSKPGFLSRILLGSGVF